MNLPENCDDKRYDEVLDLLKLRYVPVTSISFTPPRHHHPMLHLIDRIGRTAAILIVGIGIGLFFAYPDVTFATDKVIELGLEKMYSAGGCHINFNVRGLTSGSAIPVTISRDGTMIPLTLNYQPGSGKPEISIGWTDGRVRHSLTANPDSVTLDGKRLPLEAISSEDFKIFSRLLYSGPDEAGKLLDSSKTRMTRSGDKITIEQYARNGEVQIEIVFSHSTGRILSFKAYDTSRKPHLLMLETTGITYIKNT